MEGTDKLFELQTADRKPKIRLRLSYVHIFCTYANKLTKHTH